LGAAVSGFGGVGASVAMSWGCGIGMASIGLIVRMIGLTFGGARFFSCFSTGLGASFEVVPPSWTVWRLS
jgi:hypothetical protein